MTRTVIIQPQAESSLENITDSISNRVSVASALRWLATATFNIDQLSVDAEFWPEADEAVVLGMNLRCRLFGRRRHIYRILFTYDKESVYVHFIRHASQDRIA